ncbi:MAG: carboxypeptidase-like regulatory domain-containing protein, partial [Holophagae bacterium]
MSLVGSKRWNCLLVVLLATSSFATGADAAPLSGTVTDDVGVPLAGIEVSAYTSSDTGWQLAGFTESEPDGAYLLDGLPEGDYRVLFRDWSQTFAFQYHPGVSSIDEAWDVAVTAGGAVVDATLPPGGRITGVVTDGAGAPLEYPIVFVYTSGDQPEVLFVGQVDEPTGIYEVGGLPTGDYLMMFSGRRGPVSWTEFYDDALQLGDAAPIAVTAGQITSGIDAQLGPPPGGYPGGLEGIVSATDGTPLPEIEVSVYASVGPGEWTLVSYQSTDADGAFAFLELPADTYTLGFRDWNQV